MVLAIVVKVLRVLGVLWSFFCMEMFPYAGFIYLFELAHVCNFPYLLAVVPVT